MRFNYDQLLFTVNREKIILNLSRNKSILHIGACDSPFTEKKFKSGQLLHQKLMSVSNNVMGTDIDLDSISFLKAKGIKNIIYNRLENFQLINFTPDIIILGETIEHLENPGNFLNNLKKIMNNNTRLIISTPNCYSFIWQIMILFNLETIHSDHKIGFSYGLLRQLLESKGYKIEKFFFTYLERERYPLWRKIWFLLGFLRKGWAETLLAIVKKSN